MTRYFELGIIGMIVKMMMIKIRSFDQTVVYDLLVTENVVNNAFVLPIHQLLLVLLHLLQQGRQRQVVTLFLGLVEVNALLAAGEALDSITDRAVVAEGSDATRQVVDRVSPNENPSRSSHTVIELGPFPVSNSGRTESDHL